MRKDVHVVPMNSTVQRRVNVFLFLKSAMAYLTVETTLMKPNASIALKINFNVTVQKNASVKRKYAIKFKTVLTVQMKKAVM